MSREFSHAPMSFRQMPPGVRNLVIANVAVFLLAALSGPQFHQHFGLVPKLVLEQRWIWQPFTYMFVHGGFFHLFFNMFMLWMFGMAVESAWGTRQFLKFYFICGLGVAAVSLLINPHSMAPLVGASGAIYGLLVAFAMIFPDAVIYLYFFIPVKAAHMAVICGLIELLAMSSEGTHGGVARYAHVAGMVIGYLYIRWWGELTLRAKSAWGGLAGGVSLPRPRRSARPRPAAPPPDGAASMEDVDRILDKILAQGLESLTETERAVMKRYSDRMRH
ncbi:MAG: rhomboid family intramembrane serine protease [Elusimicrobiota bacterium]|jgi:membrane associated rhomboid family serine protease